MLKTRKVGPQNSGLCSQVVVSPGLIILQQDFFYSAVFVILFADFLWKKVKEEKRDHQDGEDRGLQGDDRSLRRHRQTRQRGSSHRRSTQLPEGESFPATDMSLSKFHLKFTTAYY
jgi:hypothetical protein